MHQTLGSARLGSTVAALLLAVGWLAFPRPALAIQGQESSDDDKGKAASILLRSDSLAKEAAVLAAGSVAPSRNEGPFAPLVTGADAASRPAATQRGRDFSFQAPRGWFGIKGGLFLARADSDIFDFNNRQLTLSNSDFNAPLFGIEGAWSINERVDAVFGVEFQSTSPRSEFRDFVDEFGAPITQQTELRQVPLTASLRFYLTDRGRRVGNYAWVPASFAPYVGGGAGVVWWRYQQFGDFVDFVDFTIFSEHFATDGVAPTAHVFGGADISLATRVGLYVEARYAWASDELAPAFVGFEPIDLAGLRTTAGIAFRF